MRSSACCCPGRLPSKRPTESSTTFCARPTSPSRVLQQPVQQPACISAHCGASPAAQARKFPVRGASWCVASACAMRWRADRNDAGSAFTDRVPSRPAPDASSLASAGRRCPACGRSGSRNSLTEPSRYAGSCGNTRNQIAAALLASEAELLVSPPRGARIWPALTTGRACYR